MTTSLRASVEASLVRCGVPPERWYVYRKPCSACGGQESPVRLAGGCCEGLWVCKPCSDAAVDPSPTSRYEKGVPPGHTLQGALW